MPVTADINVIVDLDTEAARDFDNSFLHLNVGARRCRIASDCEPNLICGDLAVFFDIAAAARRSICSMTPAATIFA
jgi:hypothetical protein